MFFLTLPTPPTPAYPERIPDRRCPRRKHRRRLFRHQHLCRLRQRTWRCGDPYGSGSVHREARMIMPSSVASISAPMAFKFSVTTAIRSDSLTFSSCASLMIVVPSAKHAMTAMTGISSISVGIRSPPTSVAFRLLDLLPVRRKRYARSAVLHCLP